MPNFRVRYLLFANYLNLFAFAFFTPLFALFVTGLGGSAKTVGLASGIAAYATALMIFFFGRWENAHKHKERLVVIGYFWLAAGAVAYMLVHSIDQLFIVQIFNAIGVGLLTPALRTTYATWEDKGKEAQEWAFWDGGNHLFTATGALLGGFILSAAGGFKGLFGVIALIQLIGALVALKILRNERG